MKAVIVALLSGVALAQAATESNAPPSFQWRKNFGGPHLEMLRSMAPTADGGLIFGGYFGVGDDWIVRTDYWVVRTDENGNRYWDKFFGGSSWDLLEAVVQTRDGGFLLGGTSNSTNSGSKTSACFGLQDYWIVRIDANGNKLWDRTYGGISDDLLAAVVQTSDGGFLLAGTSLSPPSGNKTAAQLSDGDFWVVRIDAAGNALWDRTYYGGGSGYAMLSSAKATGDGGFILGRGSPAGGWWAPFYTDDFWIVRIDADGNQLWDRSYGGNGIDVLTDIQLTVNGGFILGGWTFSDISGNKSTPMRGNPSYVDYWAVRIDANGNKLWDQTAGGDHDDRLTRVVETPDGGFLLGGDSFSHISGNKTSPNLAGVEGSYTDHWLVRLDRDGNILWDQSYGTSTDDRLMAIQPTLDGGFILGGTSVVAPTNWDYCMVKIGGLGTGLRLHPLLPVNVQSEGFRFRAAAEPNYFYRTEYSGDLLNWIPLRTNAHFSGPLEILDPGARTEPRRFYRMVQMMIEGRRPEATVWRRGSFTGIARTGRLHLMVDGTEEVFLDDIQIVPGNVPESGPNVVQNGDFESELSGPWQVHPQYAETATSTKYQHRGSRSLRLVFGGGPITRDTVVAQNLLPVSTNATYTLSFWYLPTLNPLTLAVRLEDNSLRIVTNLLYQPAP